MELHLLLNCKKGE